MNAGMKALANDILEQCQKQGLTYSQVWELLTALQIRCSESVSSMQKRMESETIAELTRF